jgi:signal transduction histidine kinase
MFNIDVLHLWYNLAINIFCYIIIHLVNKHGINIKLKGFLYYYRITVLLLVLEIIFSYLPFNLHVLIRRTFIQLSFLSIAWIIIEQYTERYKQSLYLRIASSVISINIILVVLRDGFSYAAISINSIYALSFSLLLTLLIVTAIKQRDLFINLFFLEFFVGLCLSLLFDFYKILPFFMMIIFVTSLIIISLYMSRRSKILSAKVKDFETLTESQETIFKFISHDIRGPLVSINAYNTEIKSADSGAIFQEQTGRISENVNAINVLLEKFVNIARIKSHRLNLEWVDLELFIRTVIYSNSQVFEHVDYTVSYQFDRPKILSDPFYLGRILKNLIENSVKYREEARVLELNFSLKIMPNGQPVFTISDNGIGIKNPTKLFQDLYRENTKLDVEGFGYGITLIKFAIEKLNWTIRVESEAGEYTRFIMNLPEEHIG